MDQIIKTTVKMMMVDGGSKRQSTPRLYVKIPPQIASLLGEYIVPSGTAKQSLCLDHADRDTPNALRVACDGKHTNAGVTVAPRYVGVEDLSLLFICEQKTVDAKLIQAANGARLIINPFNPLLQPRRVPIRRPRKSKNGNTESVVVEAVQNPEVSEIADLKTAIAVVREMGNTTLFAAIVKIHRLANKLHVRIRADDERGLVAIQETEL